MLYLYTLISLVVLDSGWLFSMGSHYQKWLATLFAPQVNFIPIIIFYPLYAFGIVYFVLLPAVRGDHSFLKVLVSGALLGLIAYAAYDLTNHATLRDWSLVVTIVDMAWGTVLTGLTSLIAYFLYKHFK